uniref:Chemotaxis protein CheC n=1 Tax=Desulfatirhabdium butyrativorans TaxID=340467 RepID=A0A7C4VRN9_9BACT
MILTQEQQDALTELINIAFSKTAASLSDLTGHRVLLDVPKVDIIPIEDMNRKLGSFIQGEVATVHQIFTGTLAGDAMLVLNADGASMLVNLLTGQERPGIRVDATGREVLTEIGNILLNACLGMFGNLLKVHVSFSVPRLFIEDLEAMMDTLVIGQDELRYALTVSTNFRVQGSAVEGYLVIVLGVVSLDQLIHAIERWAEHPITE